MAIQRINLGTAPSGTGGDTNRSAFKKIDDNFADSANAASRQVGTGAGNVMEVGAFGLGGQLSKKLISNATTVNQAAQELDYATCFGSAQDKSGSIAHTWSPFIFVKVNDGMFVLSVDKSGKGVKIAASFDGNSTDFIYDLRTSRNTQVDPNGFIKNASPIVSLYANKIELNDEAKLQPITLEKLGVGDYLVKGSTGFAQEGWYIEMPKDANGNVLVAVIYEQLENNDISVKTYAKKFDEETGDIIPNLAKPRDIPSTRWIDLRLQALPQPDIKTFSTDETVATNAE